ncbi:uncharacterized protein C10orf95-like [Oenanthe melanoleuca]|uniref:uncharacterized protein C10orf95-like n=1 Tax=Oenanthe melanoleuca TaxID=2939378 RepID=UPI0024C148E2|nr:uncharacterized protein C10orf95-like [Oenanthe melanoleuca]
MLILGLRSGCHGVTERRSSEAAAPRRPGQRSGRARPDRAPSSQALPEAPPTRPYLGAQLPASVTVPEEHKGTFGHGIDAPGNSGRAGLRRRPPAPRAGGRGPSAARLRRMRGPVPPRGGRSAEAAALGALGAAGSAVGVPQLLRLSRLGTQLACAPRHPSAQSLCPQRASAPQSRLPARRGCAEGCAAVIAAMGALGSFVPIRRLIGKRYLDL